MTTAPYVLACIDGSSYSEAVCDYANWIADTVAAPLHLLHTVEHSRAPATADLSGAIGLGASEDLLSELTELEQNRSRLLLKKGTVMLNAARARAEAAGIPEIHTVQRHGPLSEALVDLEDSTRVLVVGIRGENHADGQHGIGMQLEGLIRALHKPILVVNGSFRPVRNVMLAYDGGVAADKALQLVASSPLFRDAKCHLVHVGDESDEQDPILKKGAAALADAGLTFTSVHLRGKSLEALSRYQTEHAIDLTVMGAFGHTRLRHFLLGSFTAQMLDRTEQPLLLLR